MRLDSPRALWLVCAAAVVLRALAIVVLRSWEAPNAIEHEALATHLVEGRGFAFYDFGYFGPSSVQSPTYPLLLAGAFLLFGTGAPGAYALVLALNCLIGGFAVLGTARLARALGGSSLHALAAAALVAIWPTQLYAATHAQAVTLIIACTVWMMALFVEATRSGELRPWLGYALAATLGSITEPSLLPVSALSGLVVLAWRPLSPAVRLRNAAVLLCAALLVIGPWALRNWQVHGALMPVKSTFWVNAWKGANDYATGTDRLARQGVDLERSEERFFTTDVAPDHEHQYDRLSAEQRAELTGKTEVEREAIFQRYATTWIRANPRRYLELCVIRLKKSLWVDWDNPKSHNLAYVSARAAVLLLSLPGLLIAVTLRWRLFFPLLVFASILALNSLVLTAARFALPLEPFQLVLGSATLVWVLSRIGSLSPEGRAFSPPR